MNVSRLSKLIAAMVAVGVVVLGVSLLFLSGPVNTDRSEIELGEIEVPAGTPLGLGLVVFDSDVTGNFEVYTRGQAGGEQLALTSDASYDSWRPRLSPDRRTVLFYRTRAGTGVSDERLASLWMIDSDGANAVEVLPAGAHGWERQGNAEWSPGRDELAMMAGDATTRGVYVTSLDGRTVRRLDTGPGEAMDPSWSPDGDLVLYVRCGRSNCDPTGHEVFVVRALGGEPIRLTEDNFQDQLPVLSPTSDFIAMRTRFTGDGDATEVWDIRTMPTERFEDPVRLVNDDSVSGGPRWLDDDTLIFHRSTDALNQTDIYVGSSSGSTVMPWLETPATEQNPTP